MKIGIVGAGNMGRTLGLLWKEKGHEVLFATRNQNSIEYLLSLAPDAKVGSIPEAVAFGDVILYCLRETLPSQVADASLWKGKILIDINNWTIPSDFNYPPIVTSFSKLYQDSVPEAIVVKAFNHLAQEVYYHGREELKKLKVSGFYAGDHPPSKELVKQLIEETGLAPVDCGGLESARLLETFADMVRLLIAGKGMGPCLVFESKVVPTAPNAPFGERQPSNFK